MMHGIGFLSLLAATVTLNCVVGDPISPIPIDSCPDDCVCNDINCANGTDGISCQEVEVLCRNANVSGRLELLPRNVTRLSITGENMGHTTLDIFHQFKHMRKLALNNNGIRSLRLSKRLRLLDFLSLDNNRICFLPRKNMTLLRRLHILKIRGNNLTFIHENVFPAHVRILDLSHNHIQTPRKGSFRRLPRLELLRLLNNSITQINPLTFRFMPNLEILDLDFNLISELGPDSFKLLPYISLVSLKHNFISKIDPDAFKGMGIRYHQLHEIRLEYNAITSLDLSSIQILKPRKNIYSIYLAGNPLYCDCKIVYARDDVGRLLRDLHLATCVSPPELEGVTIADLEISGCNYEDDFYYDYY